jgi:hypothetical protein
MENASFEIKGIIPSFRSALQLRVSFGLLNNPPPFSIHPRLLVWFLNNLVFTWRTRISLFVWLLPP